MKHWQGKLNNIDVDKSTDRNIDIAKLLLLYYYYLVQMISCGEAEIFV